MTAEKKVYEMIGRAREMNIDTLIQLVSESYEIHYQYAKTYGEAAELGVSWDAEKKLFVVNDLYNEKKYYGDTVHEAYLECYYTILEEVYFDELKAEREQEEADYRKNIDICIARERY